MIQVDPLSPTDMTPQSFKVKSFWRRISPTVFSVLGVLGLVVGLGMLLILLITVFTDGLPWLDLQFLTSPDSRFANKAGVQVALAGTLYMMLVSILVSLPVGIMAAIYLEEYASDNWLSRLIEINISNLAAVPSIIYGLLGLAVFVRTLGMGRSILAGAFTMALLVLPIIIVASREAIRAVPKGFREASFGLGATKWQTIWHHVLPYALPGILTGNILAASRAIGETAPLVTIGALTYVPFLPRDLMDRFTVLPIIIFNWTSKPQEEFHAIAAAAIIMLLGILLVLNSVAVFLRQRMKIRY